MKFSPPLRVEPRGDELLVVAANRSRTFEQANIERLTVRELSPDRTAIVTGVAIGLGLAAGFVTYRAVGGCDEVADEENGGGSWLGCAGFFFAVPAAGAAGSLSLLVTLPLTKPLGERLE